MQTVPFKQNQPLKIFSDIYKNIYSEMVMQINGYKENKTKKKT